MGLADINEQRNISLYQILIYVVLFLISGYISYRYMIVPEVKKLQLARNENGKQKKLLKEFEDSTREMEMITNNVQMLQANLVTLRSQVFNDENDVLAFMRSLPETTTQTGNRLMSIVPMEVKVINAPSNPNDPNAQNTKNISNAEAIPVTPPTALPCKLKPMEITFDGGYTNVIDFFRQLDSAKQYMTVSNITIAGSQYDPSLVNVKTVLNLVQLGIETSTHNIDVAKLQQSSQTKNVVSTQGNISKPSTPQTLNQKPVVSNVASNRVDNGSKFVKNVPVASPGVTKPASTAVKPVSPSVKVAQANKPLAVSSKSVEKTPITTGSSRQAPKVAKTTQPAKQVASVPKPETKVIEPTPIAKETIKTPIKTAHKANGKSGNFSVRVGKFDYYENAQKLLNILKSHGYSGWMKTHSYKGKRTHWVYVGSFDTKDKAEAFAASMQKELSYIEDYVIMGVKRGIRNNS